MFINRLIIVSKKVVFRNFGIWNICILVLVVLIIVSVMLFIVSLNISMGKVSSKVMGLWVCVMF